MSSERIAMSLLMSLGICCSKPESMAVVQKVDISKMEGSWIEIARMPILAQKTSEYGWQDHYQIQPDGTILVTGSYRKRFTPRSLEACQCQSSYSGSHGTCKMERPIYLAFYSASMDR